MFSQDCHHASVNNLLNHTRMIITFSPLGNNDFLLTHDTHFLFRFLEEVLVMYEREGVDRILHASRLFILVTQSHS